MHFLYIFKRSFCQSSRNISQSSKYSFKRVLYVGLENLEKIFGKDHAVCIVWQKIADIKFGKTIYTRAPDKLPAFKEISMLQDDYMVKQSEYALCMRSYHEISEKYDKARNILQKDFYLPFRQSETDYDNAEDNYLKLKDACITVENERSHIQSRIKETLNEMNNLKLIYSNYFDDHKDDLLNIEKDMDSVLQQMKNGINFVENSKRLHVNNTLRLKETNFKEKEKALLTLQQEETSLLLKYNQIISDYKDSEIYKHTALTSKHQCRVKYDQEQHEVEKLSRERNIEYKKLNEAIIVMFNVATEHFQKVKEFSEYNTFFSFKSTLLSMLFTVLGIIYSSHRFKGLQSEIQGNTKEIKDMRESLDRSLEAFTSLLKVKSGERIMRSEVSSQSETDKERLDSEKQLRLKGEKSLDASINTETARLQDDHSAHISDATSTASGPPPPASAPPPLPVSTSPMQHTVVASLVFGACALLFQAIVALK